MAPRAQPATSAPFNPYVTGNDRTVAYTPCGLCNEWHRGDYSCATAANVSPDPQPCWLCKKSHPWRITCAMVDDWQAWNDAKYASAWGATIGEAWDIAQVVARLDGGIAQLERTELLQRDRPTDATIQ